MGDLVDKLWNIDGGLKWSKSNWLGNFNITTTNSSEIYDPLGLTTDPAIGGLGGTESKVVDGWSKEGPPSYYNTNRNSINVSMDGNYFLDGALGGDHEIRFGVDYYTADTSDSFIAPNQRITYVYRDAPQDNYLAIWPDFSSDVNLKRVSAYVQDTVTWGKLTASFGVRYDKEQGTVNKWNQPDFQWYEPGSPHHGEVIYQDRIPAQDLQDFKPDAAWSLISPRISFTYDITGDGKNVVSLSAGRYMGRSGKYIHKSLHSQKMGCGYVVRQQYR